jgi:hypothetical protein
LLDEFSIADSPTRLRDDFLEFGRVGRVDFDLVYVDASFILGF